MDPYIFMDVDKYWQKLGYRTVLFYAYFLTLMKGETTDITLLLRRLVSVDEKFARVVRNLVDEGFMNSGVHTLTPAAMAVVRHLIIDGLGTDQPTLNGAVIRGAEGTRDAPKEWVDKGSEYLINLVRRIPDVKVYSEDDPRGRSVIVYRRAQEPALLFWFLRLQRLGDDDFNLLFILRNRANTLVGTPPKGLKGVSPSLFIPVAAAPTYGERIVATAPECHNWLIGPINLEAVGHQLSLQGKPTQAHYDALIRFISPDRGGIVDGVALGRFFEIFFRSVEARGAA